MIEDQDTRISLTSRRMAAATNQQLADDVGMSTSACWRRVRALEEAGVIRGYAALVRASRRALRCPPSFTCRWSGTTPNSSTSSSRA